MRILEIENVKDAPRWFDALPVWSVGHGDTLRIVYKNKLGEFLAYSARRGYVGPFAEVWRAIAATDTEE